MSNSDETWQYWGNHDPYFGVLTDPSFGRARLDEDARSRFFASGKDYVDFALTTVKQRLDPQFRPRRALDFGCGVGRLTIPLARICDSVVGIDVAEGMLAEARANAEKEGISNVTFVKSDLDLSQVTGTFDYLNSFIVFQHIRPRRGEVVFQHMLERLREGGVGTLQFTYGFGSATSRVRRALVQAYYAAPMLWSTRNLVKKRPFGEPLMEMNAYDLNRLFCILQESGCELVYPRFTETSSFGNKFYGVILFFQKRNLGETVHA